MLDQLKGLLEPPSGYHKLLDDVFGPIVSSVDFTLDVVMEFIRTGNFYAPLTLQVEQRFIEILQQLGESHWRILRLHYGLDGEKSHDETWVANELQVGVSYIKAVILRSVRFLGYGDFRRQLSEIPRTYNDALGCVDHFWSKFDIAQSRLARGEAGREEYLDEVKRIKIDCLSRRLESRICHYLRCAGLRTLGDVCQKSEEELRRVNNFGEKGLKDLLALLKELGLELAKE